MDDEKPDAARFVESSPALEDFALTFTPQLVLLYPDGSGVVRTFSADYATVLREVPASTRDVAQAQMAGALVRVATVADERLARLHESAAVADPSSPMSLSAGELTALCAELRDARESAARLAAAEEANEAARQSLLLISRSAWGGGRIEAHGKRVEISLGTHEESWTCRCGGSWPCPTVEAFEKLGLDIPESVDRDRIPDPSPERKALALREYLNYQEAKGRLPRADVLEYESRLRSVFGDDAEALLGAATQEMEVAEMLAVSGSPERLAELLARVESAGR